eukprot:scaffold4850_cov213-Pinguiococcus_pyrenoidosus.AAC.5
MYSFCALFERETTTSYALETSCTCASGRTRACLTILHRAAPSGGMLWCWVLRHRAADPALRRADTHPKPGLSAQPPRRRPKAPETVRVRFAVAGLEQRRRTSARSCLIPRHQERARTPPPSNPSA